MAQSDMSVDIIDITRMLHPFNAKVLEVHLHDYMQLDEFKELCDQPTFDKLKWFNSIFYTGQVEHKHQGSSQEKELIKPNELVYIVGDIDDRLIVTVGTTITRTRTKSDPFDAKFIPTPPPRTSLSTFKVAFVLTLLDIGVEQPRPVIPSAWVFDGEKYEKKDEWQLEGNNKNAEEFDGKSGNLYTQHPLSSMQQIIQTLLDERENIIGCPTCFGHYTQKKVHNIVTNIYWGCNRYPYCRQIDRTRMDGVKGAEATPGTEICPDCGSQMGLKKNRKGQQFWGCTAFPVCRKTKNYNPNKIANWNQVEPIW